MVGFKILRNFYATCGESVQPLQSVKTNHLVMVTVKSDLDTYMINKLKYGLNLLSGYSCGLTEYQPSVYSSLLTAAPSEKMCEPVEDVAEC